MNVGLPSPAWGRGMIKICGVRQPADVHAALSGGAQLIGLVFVPGSRRCLTLDQASELRACIGPRGLAVGVFMDQAPQQVLDTARAIQLDALQLHGSEQTDEALLAAWPIIKRVAPHDVDALRRLGRAVPLLDPGAGQGVAYQWRRSSIDARAAFVAGGLTPANVADTIRLTGARGVDVSSGVEGADGYKDADAIARFCAEAKQAFAQLNLKAGAAA